MLMLYYNYMDRFKCIPESWQSLFEFMNYTETDSAIKKLVKETTEGA